MTHYVFPGVYTEKMQDVHISVNRSATAVPAFLCIKQEEFDFIKTCGNQGEAIDDHALIPSWLYVAKKLQAKTPASDYGLTRSLKAYFENGGGPCYVVAESATVDTLPNVTLFVAEVEQDDQVYDYCRRNKKVFGILSSPPLMFDAEHIEKLNEDVDELIEKIDIAEAKISESIDLIEPILAELLKAKLGPKQSPSDDSIYSGNANDRAHNVLNQVFAGKATALMSLQNAKVFSKNVADALDEGRHVIAADAVHRAITGIRVALDAVGAAESAAEQMPGVDGLSVQKLYAPTRHALDSLRPARLAVKSASDAAAPLEKVLQRFGQDSESCAAYGPCFETADKKSVPASAVMAGIYCRVDRDRGVWKAPANVDVWGELTVTDPISMDVIGQITTGLHPINIIRAMADRPPVVWGARTLAGSKQLDFRYVSVRRLFNSIEKDIRAALDTAVYEANSPATWERVRGAIANYLYAIWQKGALVGDSPEEAYLVQVGLGVTMNPSDVASGRMVVRVALAPARPAEFVVLQFSQQTR